MALKTKQFGELLKKHHFNFFSGVPCSFLKDLINFAINELRYVAAANEGDAIAIAAGAYLGGQKSVVLMQNSGLTNAVSPLTSLVDTFRIPVLGFVSLRGEPELSDEPQHELMGQITTQLLDTMRIKWAYLSSNINDVENQLLEAERIIGQNKPFFFVVRKGTFDQETLLKSAIPTVKNEIKKSETLENEMPSRWNTLKLINSWKDPNTLFLATTGVTGRELYEIEDAPNNFYMVGSMGCVGSLGLGLALLRPDKRVIVIDGDGSLLMRMGSLATNAAYGSSNMFHILLDNAIHDSTGGQDTASGNIKFVDIASACGYRRSIYVHNLVELQQSFVLWKNDPQLTFIHLRINKSTKENLGRPKIKPYEVKDRLISFIKEGK